MKYKNIHSAIHNFGHSFTSLMNYVDSDYVMDELAKIHAARRDISVDWLTGSFEPKQLETPRITKSIEYWRDSLSKHLASQNVEMNRLKEIRFCWPTGGRKYMEAIDDRGENYKIYVNETK
jgi:hypothetical protein